MLHLVLMLPRVVCHVLYLERVVWSLSLSLIVCVCPDLNYTLLSYDVGGVRICTCIDVGSIVNCN